MSVPNRRPPPQDQNGQTVVIRLSRIQFSAIAVISSAFLGLVFVIYSGIKDDIKETKESVNKLDESFRSAYKAALDVQQLITTSRDLQHDIADTREKVFKLEAGLNPIGPFGVPLD